MKKTAYFVARILLISFLVDAGIFAQNYPVNPSDRQPLKPALLVIDIQNEYLKYMSDDDRKLAMEIINGAISTFRKQNLPVIRVYHTDPRWGPEPGTEPFEFPKSVIIQNQDPSVVKNFPNAFTKTSLDKILKERGCRTLFLCGLSSVGCVLATYFGGLDRDYKVFMIKEGIMSHNSAYTAVIKDICEAVSFETMIFMLEHIK